MILCPGTPFAPITNSHPLICEMRTNFLREFESTEVKVQDNHFLIIKENSESQTHLAQLTAAAVLSTAKTGNCSEAISRSRMIKKQIWKDRNLIWKDRNLKPRWTTSLVMKTSMDHILQKLSLSCNTLIFMNLNVFRFEDM